MIQYVVSRGMTNIQDVVPKPLSTVVILAPCGRLNGHKALCYGGFAPESRLIKRPEDRREVARAVIEKLGGKVHGFWYAFGEHDGFLLIEAPDNVTAAAFSVGISAGGSLRSAETTVLLTVEETIDMLRRAQEVTYRPPGEVK